MKSRWDHLIENLSTWKKGNVRAVHKPLLTLMLVSRAQRGKSRTLSYRDTHELLKSLLAKYGAPRKSYHSEFPFWYLQNDGYWVLHKNEELVARKGKQQPTHASLIRSDASGEVPEELWDELVQNPELTSRIAQALLDQFWPTTYHEDILSDVGVAVSFHGSKRRDPKFRGEVLRAYGQKCAFCGFFGMLGEVAYGLEAAHIKFKQDAGPDEIRNGLALCPLHHKAFDRGAVGLTEDRKILVSAELHGNEVVEQSIVRLHNEPIQVPRLSDHAPAVRFVAWHQKNVFRRPAIS